MRDTPPPILTPWLHCLMLFSLSTVVFTIILMAVGHSIFGDMRPLNGLFVMAVGAFAVLVAVLVATRYVLRVARRIPD
jgi:hypothetical protein